MGISRQESLIHWNYFLAIEEDLNHLSRYVDFSSNNDTYSIEIARILMAASAEIDVVLKQLCHNISPSIKVGSINEYFNVINGSLNNFKSFVVIIPTQGLELQPWSNWANGIPPLWWQANNKLKHNRHEYFNEAKLKNCLNSVAALYISVLHLYYDQANKGELLNLPKLFNVEDKYFGGTSMGRFGHSFKYKIIVDPA